MHILLGKSQLGYLYISGLVNSIDPTEQSVCSIECINLAMTSVESHREHYAQLIKISLMLSKDDLKNLIFAYGDVLPSAAANKVTAGTDLFRELKQRGRLSPSNYGCLKERLVTIGREDLASMLPDPVNVSDGEKDGRYFPAEVNIAANLRACAEGASDAAYSYRMLLLHLSEQITNEEVQKVAFVMCPELCDESIDALGLIRYLSNNRDITSISFLKLLSSTLIIIGRTDLAQFLNSSSVEATLALSISLSKLTTTATN